MIIGLTGYAQSGKDTVASFLVEHYGFTRVAFADKLREFSYEINPIVKPGLKLQDAVDEMGWEKAKVRIPEVRRILQDVGLSARNMFGTTVWVDQVAKVMPSGPVVITDVRFLNEAQFIKNAAGEIWRVERPGVLAVNSHISESQLDGFNFDNVINNDGDLKDLFSEVAEAIMVHNGR